MPGRQKFSRNFRQKVLSTFLRIPNVLLRNDKRFQKFICFFFVDKCSELVHIIISLGCRQLGNSTLLIRLPGTVSNGLNARQLEMGQEYSTIMQIIVKADRRKAIAWRSVSCKMTCYYIPDVKTLQILSLHFVPTLQSAVYILYPVCSLLSAFLVYFWLHLFAKHT